MGTVVFALALAAASSLVTWWAVRSRPARPRDDTASRGGGGLHPLERDSTIVLDLDADAASDDRAQRLIRTAAAQVFAQEERVEQVTVTNRDGQVLARIPRTAPPLREVPDVKVPQREEHRGHTPSPVPHDEAPPLPEIDPDGLEIEPAHRDLAELLDLPDDVAALVDDPEDPADILRAILAASGADATREDDIVRAGKHVFVVVDGHGRAILGNVLSRAYLHFESTGAKRGYVVLLGFVDPAELSRRQALAPQLTYVGRDAIQRMADAVAVGADPMAFVTPPKVEIVRS